MADPAPDLPGFDSVLAARERIAGHVRRTPLLVSEALDAMTGAQLIFKCENLQRIGAFKARGAFNAVLSLPEEAARNGVVTHSSGNHALAVALAARSRGIPATIVMPRTAPAAKRGGVVALGADIVEVEPTLAAREAAATALCAERSAAFVHPFADPAVIAGQGTAALELLEDAPFALDMLLCPVGGGGLLGGSCITAAARAPEALVIAAEPEAADDAARGFRAGTLQPQVLPVATICDGLTTAMSPLTFALMRAHAHDVVTVSEAAILQAMRLVFQHLKQVIEPSCAVPLAAVLEGRVDVRGAAAAIILTGGNVDLDRLPWMN